MNRSNASIIDSVGNKRAGIRYLPATKIEGENASKVRLLVGRSNQNSEVNRTFAK